MAFVQLKEAEIRELTAKKDFLEQRNAEGDIPKEKNIVAWDDAQPEQKRTQIGGKLIGEQDEKAG